MRNKAGLKITEEQIYKYCFPYYRFKQDDIIAIYGAGSVGSYFYNELIKGGYLSISGILDKQIESLPNGTVKVHKPEDIVSMTYDYVVIAVINQITAMSIKKELMELGVAEETIIWDGEYYDMYNRLHHIECRKERLLQRLLSEPEKKIYLMSLFEGHNIGDFAISEGEYKWVFECFNEYKLVRLALKDWGAIKDIMKQAIKADDLIFFSGGGNYGDLWNHNPWIYEVSHVFPDNIKVLLPNNLAYSMNSEREKVMIADLDKARECKNLYLVFRDVTSYEWYAEKGMKDRVLCYPDMAMLLDYSRQEYSVDNRVLLCFRDDVEKKYNIKDSVENMLKEMNISYEYGDTIADEYISLEDGTSRLEKYLRGYGKYRLIITDRLHGMIFAAITGTPCIAIDNATSKVKNVYKWLEHIEYIKFIEGGKVQMEDIECMFSRGHNLYDNTGIWAKQLELSNIVKELVEAIVHV